MTMPNRRVERIQCICGQCGKQFEVTPGMHRSKMKRNRNGKMFCSKACTDRWQQLTYDERKRPGSSKVYQATKASL